MEIDAMLARLGSDRARAQLLDFLQEEIREFSDR
jgi:hypothetical protein